MKTTPKSPEGNIDSKFWQLFWAARKEQTRLSQGASANGPATKAALSFADAQGWGWAKALIEASRLDRAGEIQKALVVLAQAEPEVPKKWYSLFCFIRGGPLSILGAYDDAITDYERALSDPGFDLPASAWNNLGLTLYAKGDFNGAVNAYRKALENPRYDTRANAWNNLGNALVEQGAFEEAINAYQHALKEPGFDQHSKTWLLIAQAHKQAGKTAEAKSAYEESLKLTDSVGDVHARARLGLHILRSKIAPEALSPNDRAMVSKPSEMERTIINAINDSR